MEYLHVMIALLVLLVIQFSEPSSSSQVSTNFADIDCGKRRVSRIVGGQNASMYEFPWMVSLTRSGGHFCGGVIVNKLWVLTAAHCLCSGTETLGTSSMRVRVGQQDLRYAAEEVAIISVVLHPKFLCGRYDNDIALVEMGTAVSWRTGVQPSCFPQADDSTAFGKKATVAGWGWTHEDYSKGHRSNVLQKVGLSVVDNETCRAWFLSQGKKVRIKDNQLCAGYEQGGKDACRADSGGPLMVDLQVVGLVSTGIGCARPKLPGIYTRVSSFLPWISATVSSSTLSGSSQS